MSRLIAFRMPDDLYPLFETYCESRGITMTEGVIRSVRASLAETAPAARELAAIAAKKGLATQEQIARARAEQEARRGFDALTGKPLEARKPYQKTGRRK